MVLKILTVNPVTLGHININVLSRTRTRIALVEEEYTPDEDAFVTAENIGCGQYTVLCVLFSLRSSAVIGGNASSYNITNFGKYSCISYSLLQTQELYMCDICCIYTVGAK